MKAKILLIGIILFAIISCEKEIDYDYSMYKGYWKAEYGSATYTISIQSIDPLLIDYSIEEYNWTSKNAYKNFGRLYCSYEKSTEDGTEYCDVELICLKYNKMIGLLFIVSATIPTNLSEITLIFEKQ